MTATTILSDNGASSGVSGIKTAGGNDGTLQLQTTTSGGTATTAVTIDNSQNVGVGVTPSAWYTTGGYRALQVGNASLYGISSTNSELYLATNSYNNASNNPTYITSNYATQYYQYNGQHVWRTSVSGTAGNTISFVESMRIDSSGNLSVGVTNATNTPTNGVSMLNASSSTQVGIGHSSGTAGGTGYMLFNYNGGAIGSITQNGTTGVLYNLTSDYRLKNNPEPVTGAKDFVMALQPKKWQWWDGSGEGVGFIAHEFMEVAKYSGHGEKDAVDEDGKPVYQSIQPSSSEVMANLVAFIQEQQVLITSLSERITALETK